MWEQVWGTLAQVWSTSGENATLHESHGSSTGVVEVRASLETVGQHAAFQRFDVSSSCVVPKSPDIFSYTLLHSASCCQLTLRARTAQSLINLGTECARNGLFACGRLIHATIFLSRTQHVEDMVLAGCCGDYVVGGTVGWVDGTCEVCAADEKYGHGEKTRHRPCYNASRSFTRTLKTLPDDVQANFEELVVTDVEKLKNVIYLPQNQIKARYSFHARLSDSDLDAQCLRVCSDSRIDRVVVAGVLAFAVQQPLRVRGSTSWLKATPVMGSQH